MALVFQRLLLNNSQIWNHVNRAYPTGISVFYLTWFALRQLEHYVTKQTKFKRKISSPIGGPCEWFKDPLRIPLELDGYITGRPETLRQSNNHKKSASRTHYLCLVKQQQSKYIKYGKNNVSDWLFLINVLVITSNKPQSINLQIMPNKPLNKRRTNYMH